MKVASAGFSAGIPYLGLLIVTVVASFVVDSLLERKVLPLFPQCDTARHECNNSHTQTGTWWV
jgi:hypothetical protein